MAPVVIVTGAARGLGAYMAVRFGQEGWRVVVNYSSSVEGAREVASKIQSLGGEPLVYQADVKDFGQVKAMVDSAMDRWGRIDVLVNNAGVALGPGQDHSRRCLTHEVGEEDWDLVMDTNLKGTFHCIKAVIPAMIKQREGHIISISSGMGLRGRVGYSSYSASKAGIIGLSKTVAREMGEHNIKVNVVCPGFIPHSPRLRANPPTDFLQEAVLHRSNNPEELADFIFYLSKQQNISGQTFPLESRIMF